MILLFSSLFAANAFAGVSDKEVLAAISSKLDKLQTASSWAEFVMANSDKFTPKGDAVKVDKFPLVVNGETFTLGVAYRQLFMKTDMARAEKLHTQPDLFKSLFGLDGDATLGPGGEDFKAHILKKVPVISDQDYVLEYKSFEDKGLWFQRASLVEDKKDFALRDNLKVLSPTEGGVLLREVSYVYVLRWYLRALGPQVRSTMVSEIQKLNRSVKCAAESSQPLNSELGTECWKQATVVK